MSGRALAGLAFAGALLCAAPVRAQSLERLQVKSFDLSTDRGEAAVGETLHVVLDAKFGGFVAQLDNVTLPQLYGFDVVGDERSCVGTDRGSECTERIAISPTRPGNLVVGPAVLDAIDAKTGKPTRYQTNYLTIHVVENRAPGDDDAFANAIGPLIRFLVGALIVTLLAAIAFFAVVFVLARRVRPAPAQAPAPPPPAAPVPPIDHEARFRELVAALEADPSRPRVLALRAEIRGRIGAREHETLADLLGRGAGDERSLRLLAIVERAAFVEDRHVAEAAREAVAQIRSFGAPPPPSPPPGGPP